MEEQLEQLEQTNTSDNQETQKQIEAYQRLSAEAADLGNEKMAEFYKAKAQEAASGEDKPNFIQKMLEDAKLDREYRERVSQSTAHRMGMPLTEQSWREMAEAQLRAKGETALYKMYIHEAERVRKEDELYQRN